MLKVYLLAPIVRGRKGEYKKDILNYKKRGFTKIKVDGIYLNIDEFPNLNKKTFYNNKIKFNSKYYGWKFK